MEMERGLDDDDDVEVKATHLGIIPKMSKLKNHRIASASTTAIQAKSPIPTALSIAIIR